MVFSKELMRQLRPNLGNCLKSLLTEHEDIEVGRCVKRTTNVECVMAWNARDAFFQNYVDGTAADNILQPTDKQIGNSWSNIKITSDKLVFSLSLKTL